MSTLVCDICPHACKLEEGKTGFCGVRANVGGENRDALYRLCYFGPEFRKMQGDPAGQRFFRGFYPILTPGCNIQCSFCFLPFVSRRWNLALFQPVPEEQLAAMASDGVLLWFGGEPTLHHEYVLRASQVSRERGGFVSLYTNGYLNSSVLEPLFRAVDKVSIGVKASGSGYTSDVDFDIILQSIRTAWRSNGNVWVRNTVGPSLLPCAEDNTRFAGWLRENVDPGIMVVVEPEVQPKDYAPHPVTEGSLPPPGDESPWTPFWRCKVVADSFAKSGLENVWIVEYTHMGMMRQLHIPSFTCATPRRYPRRYSDLPKPWTRRDMWLASIAAWS